MGERKGYFEEANGGTLFLDEIGELPKETQALLLRVLQNGEYIKVGSSKVEKTDVRVIAATNVNLSYAVATGKFREDLFYRLNGVMIRIPPLRRRQADGGQNGIAAIEAVQHIYCAGFIVGSHIRHAEIGELHALHGVGRERVDDGIVMQAGGDVGFRIPRTVRTGFRDIVLVDVQGRLPAGVEGRRCEGCSHQGEGHERCQQQRQYTMDLFHVQWFSFFKSDFLQK